jgi:hypothetical protein
MLAHIVMFGGIDTSNAENLWETNGTAAGTHELMRASSCPVGHPEVAPTTRIGAVEQHLAIEDRQVERIDPLTGRAADEGELRVGRVRSI